jgi:hypothetical protein
VFLVLLIDGENMKIVCLTLNKSDLIIYECVYRYLFDTVILVHGY